MGHEAIKTDRRQKDADTDKDRDRQRDMRQ